MRSSKAQASMETLLLLGGVILLAIIILYALLTLMDALGKSSAPDTQDVQQQVEDLG